jgi:hypothetical protein
MGIGYEGFPVLAVGEAKAIRDQQLDCLSDQLLSLIAKDVKRLGVDQGDPAIFFDDDHGIGSRLQQILEQRLGWLPDLVGLSSGGDAAGGLASSN